MSLISLLVTTASLQAAPFTFANFGQPSPPPNFSFDNATGTFSYNNKVNFSFLIVGPGIPVGPQAATLTLSATQTSSASVAGPFSSQNMSGTFQILRDSDSANLLSGTFSGMIFGLTGGQTATLSADDVLSGQSVSYTSAFIQFGDPNTENLSLTFTSVTPPFGITGNNLSSFDANGTGSFSAEASPLSIPAAPEPTSLAVFGLATLAAGAYGWRRRKLAAAA